MRTPASAATLLALLATSTGVRADDRPRPALDPRSGHVYFAPSAAIGKPLGSLDAGTLATSRLGWGESFGGAVGVGLSRYVLALADVGVESYGAGSACAGCSATGLRAGAFLQYHLAVGSPFDPWVAYGAGFHTLSSSDATGASSKWSGIEPLRLRVGGDWYPTRAFGFGPWLALDAGVDGTRPLGSAVAGAVHTTLSIGLRVVLDPL